MSRGGPDATADPDAAGAGVRSPGSDELGRWLEALFCGVLEATALGVPAFVVAAVTADPMAVAAASGAVVAVSWVIATYRTVLPAGPEWPPLSPFYGALRAVWYNLAYLAAVAAVARSGLFSLSPSNLAAALVVGVGVGVVAALSLPLFVAAVDVGADALRRR